MDTELFTYPKGKTNYEILNEDGEKTTITLKKWVADVLQSELPDVHKSIKTAYDNVLKEQPYLTRKQRGNCIRLAAEKKANQYQETKKKILGWNDHDFLAQFE
jgi:hypothetical protein